MLSNLMKYKYNTFLIYNLNLLTNFDITFTLVYCIFPILFMHIRLKTWLYILKWAKIDLLGLDYYNMCIVILNYLSKINKFICHYEK